MEMNEFVPIEIFCLQHNIEISFIRSLHEFGLIEITIVNETHCIKENQLVEAEKLIRLHDDLELNIEGIDVVTHLLHRIKEMQNEIRVLKTRINLFEPDVPLL